jgi:hypothetical protein
MTVEGYDALPVACFVPDKDAREPGLLICLPNGHLRYWERVSYGLAGVNRRQQLVISLPAGDYVTDLKNCNVSKKFGL